MSMQGTANVELGTATTFSFTGSGHCKLTLNTDDGSNSVWEGELPFSQGYTYSSTSMNSYDQFKDYKTTVTPSGNCKKGAGPFGVTVRITNPHAQSLSGTPLNSPVSVSNVAKLGALGPAVTASGPARAASLPIGGASIQVK